MLPMRRLHHICVTDGPDMTGKQTGGASSPDSRRCAEVIYDGTEQLYDFGDDRTQQVGNKTERKREESGGGAAGW